MEYSNQLAKIKNKRFLILSAGGQQSGIQGIYIGIEADTWSIISHAFLPYPSSIGSILDSIAYEPQSALTLEAIGRLDHKISHLFLDCAKAICANTQKSLQQPHLIVLNKFSVWKAALNENTQAKYWNLELGDAKLLAAALKAPVVTDFIRYSVLGGKQGDLPLFPGICKIAKDNQGIVSHLIVGQIAHLLIHDVHAAHTILNTDTGPGTFLINKAALEAGCPNGFDRDGTYANQGKVDAHCLEALVQDPWFTAPLPKQASIIELLPLYNHEALGALGIYDKLATLTALTARSAFDVFKREYRHLIAPETIWVSGGGANNLALMDYLKTYFDPLPVKRTDEIGIPAELFVPLALGLTVDSFCMANAGPWKSGSNPEIEGIGTWVGV
jgi:anhydro-N-acetylmuramic acid kinase